MQTSTLSTDLNAETAAAMVDAAIQKSIELGVKMNIAVVDAGANLKAFHRMDGAWLGSVDIAPVPKANGAGSQEAENTRFQQTSMSRDYIVFV